MNKAKQILEEALSYKNCGGLIEENSRLEDIILYAINQALHQPDVIKPVCPDCDSEMEPNPPLQQASIIICSACGAVNSICWDKKEVGIDDKAGTWLTLELDFCQECGKVHNYSLY